MPLLGCAPLLASCSAKPEPPLRVGAIVWPGYDCLFLARALGYFEGLPIKLVEFSSTPEAIRTFKNGALEVIAVTGDEFLRLAAEEPTAKAFLVADFSNGADAFVAQPEFDCIRKLEGKRVGVEVNATGVFVLTRALDAVGMTRADVRIVPIENEEHLTAFEEKKVDAVVTFEPHRTKIVKRGGRVLFDSSQTPGEQPDFLVTRQSVLEARLGRIRSLTAGWFKAREIMLKTPREAAVHVASREGLSPEEFVESLKLIALPSREENLRLLGQTDTELMCGLQKMHGVLRESGTFPAVEPSLALFTKGAL